METMRLGRNDLCRCGSGRKFKRCCLPRHADGPPRSDGIIPPPQPGTRSSGKRTGPPPPTFWAHPPGRPDAAPPPSGEWVEWVFVKERGWTHESELKPGDQYQLKGGGWGTYQPEEIEATGGHPFWVISGEDLDTRPVPQHCPAEVPDSAIPGRWVNAIDLRVGDVLFTRDGRRVPVTHVAVRQVKTTVYNLEVEGLHNYAVGHTGILVHNSSAAPNPRATVRQSPTDPNRLFFDFDAAAPGGRGGASVRLDPGKGMASIDGVHKNTGLPPRSTGGLLADGLQQAGLGMPAILEGFNVEKSTAAALQAGGTGQGTLIGNMLEDAARACGGTVTRWEAIKDGNIWHLRAHVSYP